MLLNYAECIELYGSDYQIKKKIKSGELYLVEKGIYSTDDNYSELDVMAKKYPRAIFTGESAFYYHSLTDVVPDYYFVATSRSDSRIHDDRIIQSYILENIANEGIEIMEHNGTPIRIYSLERMLIELMRFKSKIPYDQYKEIINNYRRLVDQMDFGKVEEYAALFKNGNSYLDMIDKEVL